LLAVRHSRLGWESCPPAPGFVNNAANIPHFLLFWCSTAVRRAQGLPILWLGGGDWLFFLTNSMSVIYKISSRQNNREENQ
jgi:hypothetical protein